ncbi:glycosyltransferase, partial [Candidatus Saccharibacteria bacterium]|nr:glycosyltransferase [Candidatus Saccharibacteria bacterium]
MKISVVVPVYNTKEYLRQCVESLLMWNNETNTEGKGFPGEILLVDNGSTDGSTELEEDLAKL